MSARTLRNRNPFLYYTALDVKKQEQKHIFRETSTLPHHNLNKMLNVNTEACNFRQIWYNIKSRILGLHKQGSK